MSDLTDVKIPSHLRRVPVGMRVPEGAFWTFLDVREWVSVPDSAVGKRIVEEYPVFTVLKILDRIPNLYRLAKPNEVVEPVDIYCQSGRFKWKPVRPRKYEMRGTLKEVRERLGEPHLYVAKLDQKSQDCRTVHLPDHHRPLRAGELIRSGDKVIYNGVREWITIGSYLIGEPVIKREERLGYMRMCRPMGEHALFLYIGKQIFLDRTTDKMTAKYPSRDEAKELLLLRAKRRRRPPVGVVMSDDYKVFYANDPDIF